VITIPERHTQTDGQTDTRTDGQHTISIPRYALSASRGNNRAAAVHGRSRRANDSQDLSRFNRPVGIMNDCVEGIIDTLPRSVFLLVTDGRLTEMGTVIVNLEVIRPT